MSARSAIVLWCVGFLVQLPGLLALVSLPVAWLAGEGQGLYAFSVTAVVSLAVGQMLVRIFRTDREADLHDAMLVAALAWLVVPLFAAVPYWMLRGDAGAAEFLNPLNALFEAFSGFTSTGLTVVASPSELPRSLQWWRSLTQWTGGVGVIVLTLAVVGSGRAHRLYQAEAREEKLMPTVKSTVRQILGIYVLYSLLAVILLWAAGAPPWEALNHGLTAIATGGFTITDDSAASFPPLLQGALLLVVVVGAVSFAAHDRLLRGRRLSALWDQGQHRLLWILLVAGAAAVALENRLVFGEGRGLESVFQWTSALCTAGFQSADLSGWSDGGKVLLATGMVLGGAAGSTAGGIKLARLYYLGKGIAWRFRNLALSPRQVPRYEIDGRGVAAREAMLVVEASAVLALAWGLLLWVGTLLLLHWAPAEATMSDVLLEVASAQGNVGLSTGVTSSELPAAGKLVLIALMWAGRLEILPVAILLGAGSRRSAAGDGRAPRNRRRFAARWLFRLRSR